MMKVLTIDPYNFNLEDIQQAARVLMNSGVVGHPTDTCYGLAASINDKKAIKHLYEIKKMPLDKPVSVLVRSLEEAEKYGEFCELALRMAAEFWPGPLTLVVPRKEALPKFLNPGAEFVGLRVIDEPVSVALLNALGGPVTTTSANLHQKPTPFEISKITAAPDLILDVGKIVEHEKPSTVIKVENERATTLRQGDLFELYRSFR